MSKQFLTLVLLCCLPAFPRAAQAQEARSLEECRQLALQQNKELAQRRLESDAAAYTHRAAQTNYLPKVQGVAGYMHFGKEISILSNEQKHTLNTLGTSFAGAAGGLLQNPQVQQIIANHPDLLPLLGQLQGKIAETGQLLNGVGHDVANAFRTDNRNMTAAAILLTQPLYMGGKIRAYDRITSLQQELADQKMRQDEQEIIYEVDQAYWQVVSLAHKLKLAKKYRATLQQLDDDVQKLVREGVATKANQLQVSVKLNEADMMLVKVDDGLLLSRMLLSQLCGLPMDGQILTADEEREDFPVEVTEVTAETEKAMAHRPELSQLEIATSIYDEKVRIVRSSFLPNLALTAGYLVSNPNGFNGFQHRFDGTWNIGLTLKVPIWNWGEGRYKVRAAQAEANIARYRTDEAREKIELQVTQATCRVNEADKKMQLARKNLENANENLRMASLGYKEGVIALTDVLQAETAWLQAHNDKIDAEIDIMLSRTSLQKALGTLTAE